MAVLVPSFSLFGTCAALKGSSLDSDQVVIFEEQDSIESPQHASTVAPKRTIRFSEPECDERKKEAEDAPVLSHAAVEAVISAAGRMARTRTAMQAPAVRSRTAMLPEQEQETLGSSAMQPSQAREQRSFGDSVANQSTMMSLSFMDSLVEDDSRPSHLEAVAGQSCAAGVVPRTRTAMQPPACRSRTAMLPEHEEVENSFAQPKFHDCIANLQTDMLPTASLQSEVAAAKMVNKRTAMQPMESLQSDWPAAPMMNMRTAMQPMGSLQSNGPVSHMVNTRTAMQPMGSLQSEEAVAPMMNMRTAMQPMWSHGLVSHMVNTRTAMQPMGSLQSDGAAAPMMNMRTAMQPMGSLQSEEAAAPMMNMRTAMQPMEFLQAADQDAGALPLDPPSSIPERSLGRTRTAMPPAATRTRTAMVLGGEEMCEEEGIAVDIKSSRKRTALLVSTTSDDPGAYSSESTSPGSRHSLGSSSSEATKPWMSRLWWK